MQYQMRIAISIIIFASIVCQANAQSLKSYLRAADEAKETSDYYSAYHFMQIVKDVKPTDTDILYKYAEAARNFNAFTKADTAYTAVLESSDNNKYPMASYWLGTVKQNLGKYQDALNFYQIYLSEHDGENEEMTKSVQERIEHVQWAIDNGTVKDSTVKVQRLGANVNTEFSEFSPIRKENDLYFSSVRFKLEPPEEHLPRKYYSGILKAKDITESAIALDSIINNPTRNTGHLTFSETQERIYYSICDYNDKGEILCELYYRDVVGETWGEPNRLPEPINMAGFSTTQPNVGYDDMLHKDVLYFVSNREGGKGKMDIWYSVMQDKDSFSEPVNLSELNTMESDITPFYHRATSALYYSTDGRNGYGSHDVFRSEKAAGEWSDPENMGLGVNSSLSDIHFSLSDDESIGFLSSNRIGSLYIDDQEEACCYDIYQVELKPIELTVRIETYDKLTGDSLTGVTIYMTEKSNGDEVLVTNTTGNKNWVTMDLNRNKYYIVSGERSGYQPDTVRFTTSRLDKSEELVHKLYLEPSTLVLEVRTFEARNRQPLPRVDIQLTDKFDQSVQNALNRNGHIVYIPISRNGEYSLLAKKKGYRNGLLDFSTANTNDIDTLVKEIYLDLGSLDDFLPLAIYFDNDHPDPRSKSQTTNKRYLETYDAYYGKKPFFKKKYARGETQLANDIDGFFEDSLKVGKQEFQSFLNILDQYLAEGLEFKIYLKGYASPLASNTYNYALGQRRINTIQNEFKSFRSGVLMQYFNSGKLEVTEKSFGEEDAPQNVSDDIRNLRLSVYSPDASIERRVEIIEIVNGQN
jgi:tetratricopeptide (TPR) repeat protein/outer membrane protein OmpA-like peptidoglycan-associated protein